MTATHERTSTVPTQIGTAPAGFTAPRVNLLPPEIYAGRAVGRLKRYLALGLGLVVVMSAGGYALAAQHLGSQKEALEAAEAETLRLTAAQGEYAEVPAVLARVQQLEEARELGMSTETLWRDYLGYVFATMPGGVKVASIQVTGATPMLAAAEPTDPLQGTEAVTQVQFSGISDTMPNAAGWQDALNSIPGFQDAWVSVVTVGEDDDTQVPHYEMAVSVQVTDEAYANRFVPAEGEG